MNDILEKYNLETGAFNPILRTKSQPITKVNKEIKDLGFDMITLMEERDGVGLAAPQIGINQRIIVTTQWKKDGKKMKYKGETVMINPEIINKSDVMIIEKEACLSLPGLQGSVERHKEIKVMFINHKGDKVMKKFSGFDSVIIQHEIDHIDGVLFIDRAIEGSVKKTKH